MNDLLPIVYLVDTENIGRRLLDEIDIVRDIDKLIIFESERTFKLSFSDFNKFKDKDIDVISVKNGNKNAMDFMIVTILGNLVASSESKEYIIISGDKGYDQVIDFWRSKGINVDRRNSLITDDNEEYDINGFD